MSEETRHRVWSEKKAKSELEKLRAETAREMFKSEALLKKVNDRLLRLEMRMGVSKPDHRRMMPDCPLCKQSVHWSPGFELWCTCNCVFDSGNYDLASKKRDTFYTSQEWLDYMEVVHKELQEIELKKELERQGLKRRRPSS